MIKKLTTPGDWKLPRSAIVLAIALLAWGIGLLFTFAAPGPAGRANDFFYDVFYRTRPPVDMRSADVVLVAADQASMTAVDQRFHFGWPWPRELWGNIAAYVDKAGAKAIAFDLVFVETSAYQNRTGDDDTFADAINGLKTPVVFGATANSKGEWAPFAPPVKNPTFGAVNVGDDKIYRLYRPEVAGKPSLATAAVKAVGDPPKIDATQPFLLHYYGPHVRSDGHQTFTYLPAAAVLGAALDGPEKAKTYGISPEMFKGKIVIMCGIAVGTFDLKTSPLSDQYPGPEVQATAIENMIRGDRVRPVHAALVAGLGLLLALGVTAGVVYPRHAALKLLFPVLAAILLFGLAILLFRGAQIYWLPPVAPLLALVLATPTAFAWTYFAEDRQRRFMLKALSKVVSPAVAEQLSRDPERLARGTMRTDLTLLFSDLANFTDLSEGMDVQQLGTFMNRYLGEMSDQVLACDGTLDKYIGDAVMCFWNAPLPQQDHAVRACRAALRMIAREQEVFSSSSSAAGGGANGGGGKKIFTRIGINTATVAVGFIGSDHLFNYTALGDGVNLASRLEGANKLYGTRILLSQNTAALVDRQFWLRQLDVLRVKGKKEPMAVYELRGERSAAAKEGGDGALSAEEQRHRDLTRLYEEALQAYRVRRWEQAEQLLLELSGRFGQDGPAEALLARVREYRRHPPEPAWDGVYISSSK